MSASNKNWPRWTFASFSKHFDNKKGSVILYVEHTDRDTGNLVDFAEFRLDGPRMNEPSHNFWLLEVTVNILIQSTMDDKDIHKLWRTIGIMAAAFTDSITGFEYGDSGNQFACFMRDDQPMRVNNFGQIDPTVRIQQATIEARYIAELLL